MAIVVDVISQLENYAITKEALEVQIMTHLICFLKFELKTEKTYTFKIKKIKIIHRFLTNNFIEYEPFDHFFVVNQHTFC